MKHSIKFTADDWFYNKVLHYAKDKGFLTAGAFARHTVQSYMNRHPLKKEEPKVFYEEDDLKR
jgi:hypothetical protein